MKKMITTLVLALLAAGVVLSQFSLRPQIGVNFASFNYESVHGAVDGRTGLHVGADLQIGKPFYIQPGLNFSTTKLQIEDFGDINVSIINVPIMLGLKFMGNEDSGSLGLRVFAGPNFAYHVNEKIDDAFTDITEDDIRDFEVSGIAGAGLDISFLFVDIGYKFGLSKFVETDAADEAVHYFIGNVGLRIGF
jgi:hypothetical protein